MLQHPASTIQAALIALYVKTAFSSILLCSSEKHTLANALCAALSLTYAAHAKKGHWKQAYQVQNQKKNEEQTNKKIGTGSCAERPVIWSRLCDPI